MELWSSTMAPRVPAVADGRRRLVGMAVRLDGISFAQQAVVSPATVGALPQLATTVLLQHSGPAASRCRSERAVAADDVLDPVTRRRARALSPDELDVVIADYAAAAAVVRAAGLGVAVDIADDGLLHQALSPLQSPSRPELVCRVIEACAPCALQIVIEDLAPRGLDLTAGQRFLSQASALCGGGDGERGEDVVVVTAGSAWLAPLYARRKARQVDQAGVALSSAAYAVGACPGRRIFGRVSSSSSLLATTRSAIAIGLHGVLIAGARDDDDGNGGDADVAVDHDG